MGVFSIHTSMLFDSKQKKFIENVSLTVDPETGLITAVIVRDEDANKSLESVSEGDIDLRGKVVMPGFVDAHTHIFLHSYEYVSASESLFHSEYTLMFK